MWDLGLFPNGADEMVPKDELKVQVLRLQAE